MATHGTKDVSGIQNNTQSPTPVNSIKNDLNKFCLKNIYCHRHLKHSI